MVFTVHPDPTCPFDPPDLVKWPISGETCSRIKLVLDACAINESALFPELDGLPLPRLALPLGPPVARRHSR